MSVLNLIRVFVLLMTAAATSLVLNPEASASRSAQLSAEQIQGRWLRVSSNCGERLPESELRRLAYRANDALSVRAIVELGEQEFRMKLFDGVACSFSEQDRAKMEFTDKQGLRCNGAMENEGGLTQLLGQGRLLFHSADGGSDAAWGVWIREARVERAGDVLILTADDFFTCEQGVPWNTYWIPWVDS